MQEQATAGIVITLVHGTFGRRAAWTKEDSAFQRQLKKRISQVPVRIVTFEWSGWNSVESRRRAATRLVEFVNQQIARSPDSQHFLVGHSHGGSLCLKALEIDPTLPKRVHGVATLATPFVSVQEREMRGADFAESGTRLLLVPLCLAVGLGSGAWMMVSGEVSVETEQSWWQEIVGLAVSIGYLGIAALIAYGLHRVSAKVTKAVTRFAVGVKETLICDPRSDLNLLIVRVAGDEASAFLAFSQSFAWMTARLWHFLAVLLVPVYWTIDRLERIKPWLPGFFMIVAGWAVALAVWANFFVDNLVLFFVGRRRVFTFSYAWDSVVSSVSEVFARAFTSPSVSVTVLAASVAISGAIVIGALALWLLLLFLAVSMIPFGPEVAAMVLFAEVSVEASPRGPWTINQFVARAGGQGLSTRHSEIYNDPRVVELLATWIEGGFAVVDV